MATEPVRPAEAKSAAVITSHLQNLLKRRDWNKLIYLMLDWNASVSYDVEDGVQDALITTNIADIATNVTDIATNTAAVLVNTNRTYTHFQVGVPGDDAQMAAWVMTEAWTLVADMGGSQVDIVTSATSQMVYSLEKNGVEIGTITIETNDSYAMVTTGNAEIDFAAGDVMTLEAPGTDDDTLAGVAFAFIGALTVV